jgi:hypothetical protein
VVKMLALNLSIYDIGSNGIMESEIEGSRELKEGFLLLHLTRRRIGGYSQRLIMIWLLSM